MDLQIDVEQIGLQLGQIHDGGLEGKTGLVSFTTVFVLWLLLNDWYLIYLILIQTLIVFFTFNCNLFEGLLKATTKKCVPLKMMYHHDHDPHHQQILMHLNHG